MSDLLRQAIVDAQILREAAMKNAKESLLEEHSKAIKEAVEKMLEAEDEEDPFGDDPGMDDLGGMDDPAAGGEDPLGGGIDIEVGGEIESSITDDVPLAATDGEPLCSCPDDDEEIEISFDELERQMSQGGEDEGEMLDREEVADELPIPAEEEEPLEEEEMMYEEDELSQLVEELMVDLGPTLATGNIGTTTAQQAENMEKALAKAQDTKVKEEVKELKKALAESNKKLATAEKNNKTLTEQRNLLKTTLFTIKDKINGINLTNARLYYANQTLASTSLNERQKKEVVVALGKADSVSKAKVIYETLQSSTASRQSAQESLREVASLNRPSLRVRPQVIVEGKKDDPVMDRMQVLAGIKPKKQGD